ncbi:L-lactate dehydrogenase complex protein LldE [Paracoccus thiocyanatus]|uniref:L-lactate dehydrogenase complex protein LldE n=1 Tax=Paracoccus thiocyanatus TaxID=34006 RepID=A0A1N6PI84_9RHOB|nr:(Fe-S)-binding protein [Paracoccus thiocyanatus]SIQ04104.1 L-lactate dehydrogenase complex protein LldE [Paracoccus thiocyanatus]
MPGEPKPTVGLFVTCLVDAIRPQIGFAALQLLQEAGCEVEVPQAQTCCGQPALNSGDDRDAAHLARQTIAAFEGYDYVVLPSGSCAATMVHGYPDLLAGDPDWAARARAMAAKTHEITSFLYDIMGYAPRGQRLHASATYHDSCSGLRDLGIAAQPRALLAQVEGLELRGLPGNDVCCGFGGTFCVKYSAISNAIVTEKAEAIEGTGADILLAGDLGCLMNMAGKLHRRGAKTRCFHTVEVLAGQADGPAIGEDAP